MAKASKLRTLGPPHNPGVRELIDGKRQWSKSLRREDAKGGFRGWNERGYLPHRDEPGLVQFVTFHLVDSFPSALRSEWAAMLRIEDNRERRLQLERYLDRGRGDCFLREARIASLVEEFLLFHNLQWYGLRAWVVMPNHIHLLLDVAETPLSKVIQELKRYTSRLANRVLGRTGAFCSQDYYDTYMRNGNHLLTTRNYIENNPVKALLVDASGKWPWSSARFRDRNGNLCIN